MNVVDTEDVFGERVLLTDTRWRAHIVATNRKVEAFLPDIAKAIASPNCVYSSLIDPDAKMFFLERDASESYGGLYLKVIVSYSVEPAVVKTAFFTKTITGGALLWVRFP